LAAERVLPESRFELQHAELPSEEAAVEEKDEIGGPKIVHAGCW
jgi:hypothetical protein